MTTLLSIDTDTATAFAIALGALFPGYCERWHAPIDARGQCTAFESRPS